MEENIRENRKFGNGIRKVFKNIGNIFATLTENDVDEAEKYEVELKNLAAVEASLKKNKDYTSNIVEEELVPKVEVKAVKTKKTAGTRQRKQVEREER